MNDKVCGVFPGQGNQYVGMGRDLYFHSEKAMRMYDLAGKVSGVDVSGISFDGPAEEQKDARNSQLITFTNSCVVSELVKDKFDFEDFAGQSIGELAALYAAGTFGEGAAGFRNGVRIVNKRGELLKENSFKDDCLVSVIGCDLKEVKDFCDSTEGELEIALYNCRGNYVIGGSPYNVHKWKDKVPGGAVVLPVTGPFHTRHYKKASEEFEKFLKGFGFEEPRVTTYANWNAKPYHAETIVDGLVKQLWNPVRWEDVISKVYVNSFVEMGPGHSLSGMIKRIKGKGSERISIQGLEDIEKIEERL